MGLDFWAVKTKKGLTNKDYRTDNYWDLLEDEELCDNTEEGVAEFFNRQNDKDLYRLCKDTVGYFVGGNPIHIKSLEDINTLADKLNDFIKENPNYEYKDEDENRLIYSNDEVKKFIKYINLVRDNGFVLWCSW